jgi:hypothetical protein
MGESFVLSASSGAGLFLLARLYGFAPKVLVQAVKRTCRAVPAGLHVSA